MECNPNWNNCHVEYLYRKNHIVRNRAAENCSETQVVDDGRKIKHAATKGNYGAEAARFWCVLRTGINDLARAYGVTPLGV
jgi:hypothetical protein